MRIPFPSQAGIAAVLVIVGSTWLGCAGTVTIDTSLAGRNQVIDGFGTCLSGAEGEQIWWQQLYLDDLGASILRMDLSPPFKSPYSNNQYNSPTWGNAGPDGYYARAYTNAVDYKRTWNVNSAQIAVMGPNIDSNTNYFNYNADTPRVAGKVVRAGNTRWAPGDFKLIGSLWSPAPWVKLSSGHTMGTQPFANGPAGNTPFPFIWLGNFSGGKLDVSGAAIPDFNDASLGGTGATSALTQFAREMAAYVHGFQRANGVQLYAISIQNELDFEEFYNSCLYLLSSQYIAALKAVRAEFNKYPDLASVQIMGPEDVLGGGDAYSLWQYGSGSTTAHKNLQFLYNIGADQTAVAVLAYCCIHGYAGDGVTAAGSDPVSWNWWANGWTTSPAPGIPSGVPGFRAYGKKSWMTETSGEDPVWLSPSTGYPNNGGWSIALKIHQALTAGCESAFVYWQFTDGNPTSASTLTSATETNTAPKYNAAKHFFKYIRPGSIRVNASVSGTTNLLASAYLHETKATMTVVLINNAANAITCQVAAPAQPFGIVTWQQFTSSNGSYWKTSSVPVVAGTSTVITPGYGVVTLYGVGSPSLRAWLSPVRTMNLAWPAGASGFQLQTTSNLAPANVWTDLTNGPASNGWFNYSTGATNPASLFRLKQ